jgi:hypothetical protein
VNTMEYDDTAAAAYYEDPENRRAIGEGRRPRRSGRLESHFPVRFRKDALAEIRDIAAREGQPVGSWIRGLVERELERRRAARIQTSTSLGPLVWREIVREPKASGVSTSNEFRDDAQDDFNRAFA